MLVFLEEGLKFLDLLIFLLEGGLNLCYHLPLLSDLGDVHLVRLELVEELEVLA